MQLPIQLQFSTVSSFRYSPRVGVSASAITDTQLYRLLNFLRKNGSELFGGANSRLFDCFPRQTAHGSFIDGTLVSVDITSPKDWYRRLSFYIYLDILFIRFHTGIVSPFFQRCFKNNVSVVWFTYPPHCTLYIHL